MSFLRRLGQKVASVTRVGARLAQSAGRVGGKYAGLVGNAMDSVSRIPLLKPFTGHPAFQSMRGIVSGVQRLAPKITKAGMVVEGASRRAERELGLRNNPMGSMNRSQTSLTLAEQRAGAKPSLVNRTNEGATGKQSLGESAIMDGF